MCFIKEEYHTGPVQISYLGQHLIQLGHQPEKECRIHLGMKDKLLAVKDLDHALTVVIGSQPVTDIECGFAYKAFAAFGLKSYNSSHDGCDTCGRHVTVLPAVIPRMFAYELEHGTKVLGIYKK